MTRQKYLEMPWSVEDTIENLKEVKDTMIERALVFDLDGKGENAVKEIEFDFGRAIKALEEIQQYRALGTVEELAEMGKPTEVKTLINNLKVVISEQHDKLKSYARLGTVEELREVMEKQRSKKQRSIDDSESHFRLSQTGFLCCCVTNKAIRYPLISLEDLDYCPRCGQCLDWSEKE